MSISVGLARHEGSERVKLEELVSVADAAMYEEKNRKHQATLREA